MPAKKLVVYNPINWLAVLLHLLILGSMVIIGGAIGGVYGIIAAGVLFVGYSHFSRHTVLADLYKGMKLLRAEARPAAIVCFQQCADFLADHRWLDRYRAVFLLSPAAVSFRETCLCNIAYTQIQMKEIDEAIKTYQSVLIEYPGCRLAETSLENIELIRNAGKRDAVVIG